MGLYLSSWRKPTQKGSELHPGPGSEPASLNALPPNCLYSFESSLSILLRGHEGNKTTPPPERGDAETHKCGNGAGLRRPSTDCVSSLPPVMDLCSWYSNTSLKALQPDFQNSILAERKISLCFSFVRTISVLKQSRKTNVEPDDTSFPKPFSLPLNCALWFFNKGQLGP